MKAQIFIDQELLPPFDGFPKEGIEFLRKLKRNNRREWFGTHKTEYEEYVKYPMQTLIAALAPTMQEYAPELDVHPKRSMFRIYRDTRFSKDKTPYKTHVAAIFTPKKEDKEAAGLYLHIEPGEIYLGGGMYTISSDRLRDIRKAIARDSDAFLKIIHEKKFFKYFGELWGEKLSRVPHGFDRNQPMQEYLRMKQFYAGASLNVNACFSGKFINIVHLHFKTVMPLVRFLNSAFGNEARK
jgi:uncharacterized protein (TIGR02453 family)